MEKPAAEYCLFWVQSWCLPSSEWASWAQFGAAVLGAATTVGVAWWVGHAQQRQAGRAIDLACKNAYLVLRDLAHITLEANTGWAGLSRAQLEDAIHELKAVPLAQLSAQHARDRMAFVSFCSGALAALSEATKKGIPLDVIAPHFQRLADSAKAELEAVRRTA